jgi:hypothetical protein
MVDGMGGEAQRSAWNPRSRITIAWHGGRRACALSAHQLVGCFLDATMADQLSSKWKLVAYEFSSRSSIPDVYSSKLRCCIQLFICACVELDFGVLGQGARLACTPL